MIICFEPNSKSNTTGYGIKNEVWFDLYEDWALIESSFATQYGIRLRNEPDMSWSEFRALLSGIMNKTPLGQIISIRSEDDPEILKNFNPAQKAVRNKWRNRNLHRMNNIDKEEQEKLFQEIVAKTFG